MGMYHRRKKEEKLHEQVRRVLMMIRCAHKHEKFPQLSRDTDAQLNLIVI